MQWLRPLLCLQSQDSKIGSGLFYHWSLFRNNTMATNHQRFTSSYGECCHFGWFATKSSRFASLSAVKFSSKFLGVRRIFARICPNFPEKLLCAFCPEIFSTKNMNNCFWCDLQNRSWLGFSANVGRHFCPDFQGFGPKFSEVLPKFSGILPKFLTNQNFLHPRLLHHCSS